MSDTRASDMLIAIWSFCDPEDREAFVTYLTITGHINSPGSAARGQAALSGECPEAPPMDGARKGPSGTAAIDPETPATPSAPQARQATAPGRMTSSPSVRDTLSSNDAIGEVKARSRLPNAAGVEPSLPEADAGGPVSASAAHSDPAERHPARSVSSAFVSSQPAGSVGVPHSIPHRSGEVKVQPAKPFRPHCLRPELCASGTRDHCHACKKAMAESEAAA